MSHTQQESSYQEYLQRVLDKAPALDDERRAEIAALFGSVIQR